MTLVSDLLRVRDKPGKSRNDTAAAGSIARPLVSRFSAKRVRYEDYAAHAVIFHKDPMTVAVKDDKLWLYNGWQRAALITSNGSAGSCRKRSAQLGRSLAGNTRLAGINRLCRQQRAPQRKSTN